MTEVIKLDNLSYCYPDGQTAISGISLTIRQGESVALIGPNGAGKSTLLLHLNGILHTDGAVKILGKTVDERNMKWVRSKVGLVFQSPDDQLFSPTVFDDVAFGPINAGYSPTEIQRRVVEALKLVEMSGYERRSPHHLSTGEKKRIAIATVLSMSPEILVIDEPTSNLDPRSKWSFIRLLQDLTLTKIIATHDLELVKALCPRTVILDRGKLIVDGVTSDILSNTELLAAHGLAAENKINAV